MPCNTCGQSRKTEEAPPYPSRKPYQRAPRYYPDYTYYPPGYNNNGGVNPGINLAVCPPGGCIDPSFYGYGPEGYGYYEPEYEPYGHYQPPPCNTYIEPYHPPCNTCVTETPCNTCATNDEPKPDEPKPDEPKPNEEKCPEGQVRQEILGNTCGLCPEMFEPDATGSSCVPMTVSGEETIPPCPSGQARQEALGYSCGECPAGSKPNASGSSCEQDILECEQGQAWDEALKDCVTKTEECAEGQTWDEILQTCAPTTETPPEPDLKALTPEHTADQSVGRSCIDRHTKAFEKHDPDSITNVKDWPTWDGVSTTPVPKYSNPDLSKIPEEVQASFKKLTEFIFPNDNFQMKGLRDLFYKVNPFKDISKPTPSEIEAWHVEVLMLLRKLVGKGGINISNDRNLYLTAQWAAERQWTTVWDASYPSIFDGRTNPGGKCHNPQSTDGHCGWLFIPNETDQQTYLSPEQQKIASPVVQSEGVFTASKNLNWSVKLAGILHHIIKNEGFTGHGGPLWRRGAMGVSFQCTDGDANAKFQWGGDKAPE